MPRELSVLGILIPTILPVFFASLLLQGALDWVLSHAGVYRRLWHPALARTADYSPPHSSNFFEKSS